MYLKAQSLSGLFVFEEKSNALVRKASPIRLLTPLSIPGCLEVIARDSCRMNIRKNVVYVNVSALGIDHLVGGILFSFGIRFGLRGCNLNCVIKEKK